MNKKTSAFPIFLAFLAMGFGDVVGPMVSLAKESYALSNVSAQLLAFSGFIMFGLLSVPVGVFQSRNGKKKVLLIGLGLAFIGLIAPIVLSGMYGKMTGGEDFYVLLLSVLLLGAGATMMQVAGNPIMRDVSAPGRYASNLSLAQSIKAIGSSMGFLLPPFVAYYFKLDWSILFPIYAVIVLLAFSWTYATPVPRPADENREGVATLSSCLRLLGNPFVLLMVLGIFLYVGAEVSMSSGIPILLQKYGFDVKKVGLLISWSLFFLPVLIGRFAGAAVLRRMAPRSFLILSSSLSLLGLALVLTGQLYGIFAGTVLVGLGFANIFPLIFSMAIDRMPERSNEISGLMVTAIVGGAFIPLLWGVCADRINVLAAFAVPALCVAYILFVALKQRNA